MKRFIVLALLLLSVDCFAAGVLGVANPAKVAGVTTPDKVSGVAGLATAATDYTQDANCLGAWYMNLDAAVSETDRTSNGNDLAVSASDEIPRSATVPSGYSGYSRDFELGDADYLSIADGTELDINGADAQISIGCWIKVETAPADTVAAYAITKHNPSTNNRQYGLMLLGTGSNQFKIAFVLSADSTSGTTASDVLNSTTTTLAEGTWYHIVGVYNDTDMRIYINGSLDCEPAAKTDGIFNGTAPFYISFPVQLIDGLVDEPFVFNRALSATEANNIYSDGISGDKGGSD